MQLSVNGFIRGVRCDLSGEQLFDHFVYYSMTGQQFYVNQAKHIINPGPKAALDIDLAPDTFDQIWNRVRDNLSAAVTNTVKCDISPTLMKGEFKYWKISIVKVEVDIKEVDTSEKVQASVVSTEEWDFNASDAEVQKFIETQKIVCAEPFDESTAPSLKKKPREVIKIPAPITKVEETPDVLKPMTEEEQEEFEPISDDEIDNALHKGAQDAGIIPPDFTVIDRAPKVERAPTGNVDPDFFQRRAAEIINKSKRRSIPPASPDTPDVEFEPEITKKKVKLPDVGARPNVKRRKNK